jgi:GTP-binding protein
MQAVRAEIIPYNGRMLIDEVAIEIAGGHGGKGAVAFNKNMMALGPAGGSGGKGGDVYVEGVADIGALRHFRFKKEFFADNGEDGRGQFRDGHAGSDIILKVPVGTVVHNLQYGWEDEVTQIGQRLLLAKGGNGGKGNFHFRGPKNTTPKQFQPGLPGERHNVRLELKLIADVGFVGFPNAGKSSMLNELTAASAKVANYPFTTLEPNLGVYYGLILADIPGLIENASEGKGLGIKFLRHIERTRVLFHFVSAESDDPARDYAIVRKELGLYNKTMLKKPEYVILSKIDEASEKDAKKKLAALKKKNKNAFTSSIATDEGLADIRVILNELEKEKFAKK